jgi:hypothetical protein
VIRTPTIYSSALCGAALWCASLSALGQSAPKAPAPSPQRIVRPEGYLQIEPDDGGASPSTFSPSTFSILPPPPEVPDAGEPAPSTSPTVEEPAPLATRPHKKKPREICQPIIDRFSARLAELRGNPGPEALDPAVQRAMFGRVALHESADVIDDGSEKIPELTWDSELKDLQRTFRKCLKAEQRR